MRGILKYCNEKVAIIMMVTVIMLYAISNVFYLHTHKLQDGTFIIHSHPFKKVTEEHPSKQHDHDDSDLAVIDLQKTLIQGEILSFEVVANLEERENHFSKLETAKNPCNRYIKSRAPPIRSVFI